ncbi:YybH family protein [Amycolatopsis jejuensis]|uniref:YybH family protein n=1 Tax=Amycolatopsis jejuensis TaxID=330084 RepID=UPI000526AE95|nr:nuclear transport factor 2 family protein [Amycolatopsis jejuensis]
MPTELYPSDQPRFTGPAEDIEEIRKAHRDWWAANFTQEVARARRNFAPDTLMFNLNGHTYYGLGEMVRCWNYYTGAIGHPDYSQLWDYRIHVEGDLAYLTCEGFFPVHADGEEGWGASNLDLDGPGEGTWVRFRETSIARRDDGEGNRVWKLWHFHCSPAAPADEERPGFGDTWTGRGGARGGAVRQTPEQPLEDA